MAILAKFIWNSIMQFSFNFFWFFQFLNNFFGHGGLGYISMFSVDAKNTHPFTFLYRLQLFSKANQFLSFRPCLEPMTLLNIFKYQFLFFSYFENPNSCQQQWWNINEMLFLLKSTPKNKKKKAQRTLLSVKGAGGVTKSQ